MAQKVCPRCGSQFATLKSATCPQCFAKLVEVDDDTAAEMAAERSKVEQTPEFQEAKAVEDERFRHLSFQACLGIAALAVVTLIVAVVGVGFARHHVRAYRTAGPPPTASPIPLPTAVQAGVGDVMPAQAGPFHREKMDQETAVSGTLTLIYHAAYHQAGSNGQTSGLIDVYAVSLDRSASDQARFRDLAHLVANTGDQQRGITEIVAKPFLYEILASPGNNATSAAQLAAFRKAWAAAVGG